MSITEQFQFNLKKYREAAQLTGAELARRSGVSRTHIWQLENKEIVPTIEIVQQLAMGLGLTIETLLGLDGKVPALRLAEEQYAFLHRHEDADETETSHDGMVRWVFYISPMQKAKWAEKESRES